MILIGENLNIMSKTLGPALRERQAGPVQEMAKAGKSGRCGLSGPQYRTCPQRRG